MARRRPRQHERKSHIRKDGRHVSGTTVNPGVLHFKSPEAYRKWNATRFIHHIPHGAGYTHRGVVIAGHPHHVVHEHYHHVHHTHTHHMM